MALELITQLCIDIILILLPIYTLLKRLSLIGTLVCNDNNYESTVPCNSLTGLVPARGHLTSESPSRTKAANLVIFLSKDSRPLKATDPIVNWMVEHPAEEIRDDLLPFLTSST